MESTGVSDPYEAVLADLRAKRAEFDRAIELLQALRGGGVTVGVDVSARPISEATARPAEAEGPGAFLGMSIAGAAKKLLTRERRSMGNVEIADALKRGGLVLNSVDPVNTIGSVMTRRYKEVGDVVKVGRGTWGLKEWYPNRTFRPTATPQDTRSVPLYVYNIASEPTASAASEEDEEL